MIVADFQYVSLLSIATSALDQMSENHVQEALKNIRKEKKVTTVTIAHRLTTIIDSDAIAVINQGSIAEYGDHLTLLNKEGSIYKSLCETQGITPSNPGMSTSFEDSTLANKKTEVVPSDSEKTETGIVGLEAGQKTQSIVELDDVDDKNDTEEVPMVSMSKIWKFLGRDTIYAVIGIVGSGAVGALSPCESILTAQIVT